MDIEPGFEFLFQGGKFWRPVAGILEGGAHFDEGAYDEDAHLDSARAPQDIGGHNRAVLGKGVWERPSATSPSL